MEAWESLVKTRFFTECPFHPGVSVRSFCIKERVAFCKSCFPDRKGMIVYRNMYQDVVRVQTHTSKNQCSFHGIKIFMCNGNRVIFLRPSKEIREYPAGTKTCPCKRSVDHKSTFCSVECMMDGMSKRIRARKSFPAQSPVM